MIAKVGDCKKLTLVTAADDEEQQQENKILLNQIGDSLFEQGILLSVQFSPTLHDRELKLSNGWVVRMGRGLDYFQSVAGNYFQLGANDLDLRPCLETTIDIFEWE